VDARESAGKESAEKESAGKESASPQPQLFLGIPSYFFFILFSPQEICILRK